MNSLKTIDPKRALVSFLIAYIIVTVLAIASSLGYSAFFNLPTQKPGESILLDPGFVATVPYHVLIMLIIWPLFAWFYFKKRVPEVKEALGLSWFWLIAAIILDYVAYVVPTHIYSLTHYEFYVVYQPWISLIYLAIFVSPFIFRWVYFIKNKRSGH
jgi:hypothetical protein